MVDRGLFIVAHRVVDDTQVDMGQEFSSYVGDFFVLHVVLNSIVVVDTIQLT